MERWTPRERHGFALSAAASFGALAGAVDAAIVLTGAHGPQGLGPRLALGAASVVIATVVSTVLSILSGPFGDDTTRGVARQIAATAVVLTGLLSWERFGWALADASRGAALAYALLPTIVAGGVYALVLRRAAQMRARGWRALWLRTGFWCAVLIGGAAAWSPPRHQPGPSVLVITTEGIRANEIGKGVFPRIDAFALGASVFSQAVTPSTSTAVAHAALWTGRHPLMLGLARDDQVLPADVDTLAALAATDATTAAFVSTTALSDAGLDRGFDTFDDGFSAWPGLDRLALVRWVRGAAWLRRSPTRTADGATAWIRAHREERFLIWVHLAEASSAVRDGTGKADLDGSVGQVLDALGPSAARTMVWIAGVRGARTSAGATPWSGVGDDVVRVPMMVHSPEPVTLPALDAQVVITDVAGAIKAFAQWPLAERPDGPEPIGSTPRPSLATTILGDDGAGHVRIALRQSDLKVVVDPMSKDVSYYDLTLDPGETTDRSGQAVEFVTGARMSLAPELAALARAREVAPLGSWRARRLRALAEE